MMTLSEFNASLPKKEDVKPKDQDDYIEWLKETLEICQKENVELRNTIKHLLEYMKERN